RRTVVYILRCRAARRYGALVAAYRHNVVGDERLLIDARSIRRGALLFVSAVILLTTGGLFARAGRAYFVIVARRIRWLLTRCGFAWCGVGVGRGRVGADLLAQVQEVRTRLLTGDASQQVMLD